MKNIAILTGGYSKEYEISLKSGNNVFKKIKDSKYKIYNIILSKKNFIYIDKNKKKININLNGFFIKKKNKIITFDLIINMIHGTPGEDGVIKNYFNFLKIPCTGSDVYTSLITFNKLLCKNIIKELNITKVPKHIYLNTKNIVNKNVIKKIYTPCIIKPNKSGSSLGVTVVNKPSKLDRAIQKAFKEDDEVIIEEFIIGREVSVGVIKFNKKIIVLPITEIVSNNTFFDYKAKYNNESTKITPAILDKKLENKIINLSKKIYTSLNISDLCRIEYIILKNNIYFLEINTIPGLTKNSILYTQLKHSKITLRRLIFSMINSNIK